MILINELTRNKTINFYVPYVLRMCVLGGGCWPGGLWLGVIEQVGLMAMGVIDRGIFSNRLMAGGYYPSKNISDYFNKLPALPHLLLSRP